jgi:hypothetical protein
MDVNVVDSILVRIRNQLTDVHNNLIKKNLKEKETLFEEEGIIEEFDSAEFVIPQEYGSTSKGNILFILRNVYKPPIRHIVNIYPLENVDDEDWE